MDDIVYGVRDVKYKAERAKDIVCELAEIFQEAWSYVNTLDTKSQTFLCCTSS